MTAIPGAGISTNVVWLWGNFNSLTNIPGIPKDLNIIFPDKVFLHLVELLNH